MRVTPGAYENHKFHYNQRTVPKPPEELQRLIFPFIKIFRNSINALDASYPGQPLDISLTSWREE